MCVCVCSDLDLGAMRALGQVLNRLVLQPKGMTGDIFEQKSKLFQKYAHVHVVVLHFHVYMCLKRPLIKKRVCRESG